MSKKINIPECLAKEIYDFYSQGNSLKDCEKKFNIYRDKISLELRRHGFNLRFRACGIKPKNIKNYLPEREICNLYMGGESENSIAKIYSVSRNVIRRILNEGKIEIRGRSEAELTKWSKMNLEQRKNQVKKAHESTVGIERTDEQKRKVAISREKNTPAWYIGCGEPEFRSWLDMNNINYLYQKAIEFYNIDFLIDKVAIELTSFVGRNRFTRPEFMNRASILNSKGIRTLAVEFRNAEELIANAKNVMDIVSKLNGGYLKDNHYLLLRLQTLSPSLEILS